MQSKSTPKKTYRPRGTLVCQSCRREYPAYPYEIRDGRKFCSPRCGAVGKTASVAPLGDFDAFHCGILAAMFVST